MGGGGGGGGGGEGGEVSSARFTLILDLSYTFTLCSMRSGAGTIISTSNVILCQATVFSDIKIDQQMLNKPIDCITCTG